MLLAMTNSSTVDYRYLEENVINPQHSIQRTSCKHEGGIVSYYAHESAWDALALSARKANNMFLSAGCAGEDYEVLRLLGRDKVQKQLMNLGVVPGSTITVLQCMGRNLIVCIKNVRLGLGRELAQHILVKPVPSHKIPHPTCKEVISYANCT